MKLTGRVDGLGGLAAQLQALADRRAIAGDLREAAEEIRERAVDNLAGSGGTSALARSLTVDAKGDDGLVVGTPLDHGWHREFGSRAHSAKPWLAPAAEAAAPGLIARVSARLRRAAPKG